MRRALGRARVWLSEPCSLERGFFIVGVTLMLVTIALGIAYIKAKNGL